MQDGKQYPVSEYFVSPQGEGVYAGQMQAFIRLAGCTVGKPYPKEHYGKVDGYDRPIQLGYIPKILPIYTEKCTLYDGREFPCDTDYRVKERLTAKELIDWIPSNVEHVCITGGEPLMHDLGTLIGYLYSANKKIHIETSGTIYPNWEVSDIWITVSPKANVLESMLNRANELKILVNEKFDLHKPIEAFREGYTGRISYDICKAALKKPVFLQPVNYENEVNVENLKLCIRWQNECPALRISPQLHKVMEHFLKERVR